MSESIFGYFDDPTQAEPAYDPGLDVLCPCCLRPLSKPIKTISLMAPGSQKSWFFRTHKVCWENATPNEKMGIESSLIDAEDTHQ